MAEEKGKKGKGKGKKSDLPVSSFNALIKPEDENNRPNINKQEYQKRIQILPFPEQVVVVKESKYGRWNFWTQLALVLCSIGMLIAVYILSSTQNKITEDALNFQIRKTFSDSIVQHVRDSLNLVKTDSSLRLTRESNKRADAGLRLTGKNMFLTTEISRTAIQPFLFADSIGEIQNLRIGEIPYNEFEITNVGATPAYRVNIWSIIMFESEFNQDTIDIYTLNKPETGWFIGSKKTTGIAKAYFHGGETWKIGDVIAFTTGKKPILFITIITYEDAFGKPHFTQQGRIRTIDKSWKELSKYERTDHDNQAKHKTKTPNPQTRRPTR